jgi:acyl-CoA synthetase (NDP forming)
MIDVRRELIDQFARDQNRHVIVISIERIPEARSFLLAVRKAAIWMPLIAMKIRAATASIPSQSLIQDSMEDDDDVWKSIFYMA